MEDDVTQPIDHPFGELGKDEVERIDLVDLDGRVAHRQVDDLPAEAGALDDGAVDGAPTAQPAQDLVELYGDLERETPRLEIDPQMPLHRATPGEFGQRMRICFETRTHEQPHVRSFRTERHADGGRCLRFQGLDVKQLAARREGVHGERRCAGTLVIRQQHAYGDVLSLRGIGSFRHGGLPGGRRAYGAGMLTRLAMPRFSCNARFYYIGIGIHL